MAAVGPTELSHCEQLREVESELDDLLSEYNDATVLLAQLGVPKNPMLSLRSHLRRVILDLRGDVAAARRERDEHRQAADLLRGEVDAVTMERDDALRTVDRWVADHDRAAEQAEAWRESAERSTSELAAIREQLREARVDGTQYEDVSNVDCVRQLADARDAAVENWGRCHRRHLDLEEKALTEADVEMMRVTTGAMTGVEPTVELESEEGE